MSNKPGLYQVSVRVPDSVWQDFAKAAKEVGMSQQRAAAAAFNAFTRLTPPARQRAFAAMLKQYGLDD